MVTAEVLRPPVLRALESYKKLQEAHAAAAAKILELDAIIAADAATIADLKAILDVAFPEDMGASMGGITG